VRPSIVYKPLSLTKGYPPHPKPLDSIANSAGFPAFSAAVRNGPVHWQRGIIAFKLAQRRMLQASLAHTCRAGANRPLKEKRKKSPVGL
jgi:hypothetical protein